jgi:ligand-binding sensor domain-containing protein
MKVLGKFFYLRLIYSLSLLTILILNFPLSQTQEWIVYNTSSNLPSNFVLAIAIDGQGNKWIGTGGGLAKFDGRNWTVYNISNSGLPDNYVRAIAIDGVGNKWIGTSVGLAKFDGVNWTVYNTSNSGLPNNDVWAIAIDGQGNKWIGTDGGGLAKFDGIKWTVYNTSNSGLPYNRVYAIAIDGQGNKWIGTYGGGLAKFDGVNWTVYNTSNSGLPDNWVYAIAIDGGGNKWIGTYGGGLAKFDGIKWTVYNTSNSGLPYNRVYAIAIDGQGNKWIGTDYGGLAKFDGVNWTVYNTSNSGLPDNWVYAIAIDGGGNKWIGTYGGGLAKFDGVNWTVYNTSNSGLSDNFVNAIAIDGQGNKWIGTDYGGLAKFDGVNWIVYNTSNSGLPSNGVSAIAIDGQGNKWIGTGGGLAKFDGVNWTVYNISNSRLPSNAVLAIAIDGQGNKWIGTYGGGLAKFDGVNWTVYNISNSRLPSNDVLAIAIDGQGNKWIGTWGGGLAKFDGVNWTVYKTSNSGLPDNDVFAIAIDGQGNKWIGTWGGGLAKFDGVNWTVYNISNSRLPSNDVFAIAIDGQGNKWIGTGNGLAKFDGVNWTVYNTSNSGLPSNAVLAIAIDGQGNKWIGTGGGGLAVYREGGVILLYVSSSQLKFESVYVSDSLNLKLRIKNFSSNQTISLNGVSFSRGDVFRVLNSFPINLAPNDSVLLDFVFKPLSSVVYKDTATISTSVGSFKIYLEGRGVRPPYLSSVDSVNFGLIVFGDSLSKSLWVKNTGEIDTVRISNVEVDAPFYVRGVSKSVLRPGDSTRIDLVLKGEVDGYRSSVLKVISNAWNDTLRVVLFGEIRRVAKISYRFNSIDFGSVYVGRDLDEGLMIYNVGSDTLRITGISVRDSVRFRYVGSLPLNVVMGDSVELRFRFRPDGSGSWVDSVLIRNNSVNDSLFKLVLRGRGVRPPYLSSVDSVNFGLIVFGDSLSKSLWVKNTGEIDTVRISNVEVDAPFYVRGVSKSVLRPGDSTRIDLVLKGDSLGFYVSVMRLISNAWNDTIKIFLYGIISISQLKFGNVYISNSLNFKLKLKNARGSSVNINGVSFSRALAFSVKNTFPMVLSPGDSVYLDFVFKPLSSGVYTDTATVSTSAGSFKIYLEGRGIRPPYLSSVDSVNFGLVIFGDSLSKSLWVKNTGEIDTVRISNVEVEAPFYVRGVSKFVLRPGDSTRIDLVLKGEVGSYRSSVLKVISNAWNDTLRVVLFGEIRRLAKISYRFNSIDFGSVYVGRDLDKGLMIYNVGSDTLRITGISVRDSVRFRYVGSLPLNVVMGDSVELRFRFRPDGSGSWVDSVLIRNNSVNDSLFKLVLRGRGVRPPYLSSVDSVNFGLIVFGDSLSKSLWVKNTGEIDTVRISNVEVDAPFYVRGVSKSVLPPGDSSRIDLVLKGEIGGYRSSILKVISNAWNDTLRVVLFGEIRRVAKISYRFNSIDFGSVYVGRDLDEGLMIYNVGSDTLRITGISVRDSVRFRYVGSLPLNVVMGDSVELRFRFRPDGSGSWVDSVLIRNNSVNDSLFKLVLRGRGVRPPYLSSVDSVNFGLIVFGDSLSKSLWVKNTGEIDTVRISNVEVDAPFYVRGVSKSVLPPGDSSRIDLVLKGEIGGYRSSILKVISNAWNDTLKVSLYGAVTPFKQFTSFRQVQSGVVKFVYQVQTTSTFDLKKFEYSTDGVNWVESKNISGSTTITGTKTDTIYWDSKKDLPNFESLNVKVRFTFTGGGVDFPVVLNVGVDNKPPSFTGVKGHSFLGFNRVKLLFNRGVDISKFDYIVSFVDTVDRVYRFYRTSLDSVVLGGFYSVAGYVFYVRCVDEFGNVGDSLRYDVKFPAVGDYNFDGKIDAYDLGVFVLGWTNRDSVCDFYPFEGRVPVVRVVGDKKLDAGDVWVFTMFWDRGKRGGFGKVSELSVESFGNERGMNLRYSGGYVTIGFDDFDVSGRFISGGVEIVYDRGSFRFDSLLFDFDGLKLSYVDSLGGVFYLDFGRGGGFDFERLGARVRFRVLREVKEGMIVKLKLYDEGLKLFERSYRISFEEVPTEYALYQNYPNPFNPINYN